MAPHPVDSEPDGDHLMTVLGIAADAIVSVDEAQRIVFFNEGAERTFGFRREEVMGRPLEVLLPERFHEVHRRHVESFGSSPEEARLMGERLEIKARRKGGEEFPAEASIAKTRSDGGLVFTVVLRDVTEQRRAREELARSERQLREAQQIASLGSWEWDIPADRVLWSEEMYRIYGLPVGSTIDFAAYLERIHPEDRDLVRETVEQGFRTGRPYQFEHRIVRPDGAVRSVHGRGEAVKGPEGTVVRMFGVGQDITERKAQEERLRRLAAEQAARRAAEASERRMAFLARASAELASSLDYQATLGTIARLAVPELADWCAVDLLDEGGRLHRLALEHPDPAKVERLRRLQERYPPRLGALLGIGYVARTGRSQLVSEVDEGVLRAVAEDEEHFEGLRALGLRSHVIAPLAARGRILGALTLVHAESGRHFGEEDRALVEDLARRAAVSIDTARLVDELRRTAEALVAADRAKDDFMATMSHELRTPLNAIIGYARLLDDGIPEPVPDGPRGQVRRIWLSARHLLQLIDEILTFSRIEAGRESVSHDEVDISALVEEVEAVVQPLAVERGLEFRVDTDGTPASVRTDPRKLRQILLNLLGNAVKFTERGGAALLIRREGSDLVFSVRDTGIGIRPEHRALLFEPFWQADQSESRRVSGTGLGLAISGRLARLLGGELSVESEPGAGSTFSLRLPTTPDGAG